MSFLDLINKTPKEFYYIILAGILVGILAGLKDRAIRHLRGKRKKKRSLTPKSPKKALMKDDNIRSTPAKVVEFKQKDVDNRKSLRKGELGEYKINIQLDQLPKGCKYLSDLLFRNPRAYSGYTQVDHIVITPYVLIVVETKNYAGEITGRKKDPKWFQNGKFEIFNPLRQNYGHIKVIQGILADVGDIEYCSIVSFTRRSIFEVDPELRKISSNELVIYDTELSDFIQRKVTYLSRQHPDPLLSVEQITRIHKLLSDANITDKSAREEHENKNRSRNSHTAKCSICDKPIPDKVRAYCLANKDRFGGKIYCFEHQSNF